MFRAILFSALVTVASAAFAGDKPIYAPAPDWVKPAPALDVDKIRDETPVMLVLDAQQRMKDGEVFSYIDTAARIASAQMLDQFGTIKVPWQPDKGDLIIHRIDILRGAERLDLLAAGQRFSVLRREEKLEERMLNGQLTATLAVEGLRVGDVLRASFSITQRDTTLKGNVQTLSVLPTDPFRVQFGRSRLIWPEALPVKWKSNVPGLKPQLITVGGYRELTITLPIDKPPEMPADAPGRYKMPPLIELTSFSDWASVAAVMTPLYATNGLIVPGSPLAAEVDRISKASSDPLQRTVASLALVQDKVRYLFKGMDGGNYLPQSPTETWTVRYGDCKAKTLLLLAMLHKMGIEAEPVLANLQLADGLADRLPSAGAFDHIFVRATVGGEVLWLDGTGIGTTLADIRDTPPFRYVLPLRATGAALMTMPMRPSARPEIAVDLSLDQTAGVNFPAPFKVTLTARGALAQLFRSASAQAGKDDLTKAMTQLLGNYITSPTIVTQGISFDDAAGTATLAATGIAYPSWTRQDQRYRRTLDIGVSDLQFAPDRSRTAWRDIPVATGNPGRYIVRSAITLPDGGEGYALEGRLTLSEALAGVQIQRAGTLADGIVTISADLTQTGNEIAVADIASERQKVAQMKQNLLRVVAPATLPPEWQIAQNGRRAGRFDRLLALYRQAIVDAPGKAEPLTNRAWFLERLYDRRLVIADLDKAIALDPTANNYLWRARMFTELGDRAKARLDVQAARKIDPVSGVAQQAWLYDDLGEKDRALALLDERIAEGGEDKTQFMSEKAELLARNGDKEAALATIDTAIAAKPGNPDLLNSRCWVKGTLSMMLDTALKDCTKSIELSDSAVAPLDSRAMVYFRLDRFDDALADLNAALDLQPDLAASLYLRGVIRKRTGDIKAAEADIAAARLISPQIDRVYARYNIVP